VHTEDASICLSDSIHPSIYLQVRTEDVRVEERAQQLAAQKIQAIAKRRDAQKAAQAELEIKREENRKLNRDMSFTANYDPKVPIKQASIKKKRITTGMPSGQDLV